MLRIFLLSLIIPAISFSQNNTQTIRGTITDKLSQAPIPGVSVQIVSLKIGAISDSLGNYVLTSLPPDRYEVKVSFTSYKTLIIPNVMVTSGKEVILDLALEEEFQHFSEVTGPFRWRR